MLFCITKSEAQFNILDRVKQKAKDKANQKIDQKIDKTIDDVVDKPGKTNRKNTDEASSNESNENKTSSDGNKSKSNGTLKSYSKFDFVPGEKIVASEDFSQDAVGDFPDKWNTNGSGEIVTLDNNIGKYLMTQKEVVFYPEWIKDLPDNFTLEFDLLCTDVFSFYSGFFVTGFTSATKVGADFRRFARFGEGRIDNGGGFEIGFHPENAGGTQGLTSFYSTKNLQEYLKNDADQNKFSRPEKNMVHISIWRQKTRVRVYMDDKKVWDLPKGCADGLKLNALYFRNDGANDKNDSYYIGNIRLAVGAPDTRNKLITEGKFITHGILFDVNSDKIKPESYGALKDIAAVLAENAEVKIKIIGHTDSDGDDASNMALSKKRAEAVKTALSKEFAIEAGRMETDGKGESQPLDKNNSPLGKSNNRRVEFIKQ
jgi:outer membrane protein OmpA-like peptidoglycan-associated protein